ncbi:hypothetical protein KCP78_01385 [Salmonella enterica subsp. enterica]|nr:hypothetical protein KCP78_01385 [Salmonella enterica subsp. enterica]
MMLNVAGVCDDKPADQQSRRAHWGKPEHILQLPADIRGRSTPQTLSNH